MNHTLLGEVMGLILNDEFYADSLVHGTRNSVYYAVKHGKCLVHRVDGVVVGYCTWGFFTAEELELDIWDGDEVYGRDGGGSLFFPKFQCRQGRREVIRFTRAIQRFVFKHHPDVETALGLRVYPDGIRRDGKWHRKVA
jgi:hemolysin-activating ACP:hemolysin acyltransferase